VTHYHAMISGRRQGASRDKAAAEHAAAQAAEDLVAEWQNRGATIESSELRHGGTLIAWDDGFIRGSAAIEVTGCTIDHSVEAAPGELMKGARCEVWAVAATEDGIWHLPGMHALLSGPLPARLSVEEAVVQLVKGIGAEGDMAVWHGTSDRDEGDCIVATNAAVIDCPDVLHHWPDAVPVAWELFDEVKQPPPHAPTEAPVEIRMVDVLLHALRHLEHYRETDSDGRGVMPPMMARHLALLHPELFRRYERGELRAAS
jgi:hypothetical protein